MKQIVNASISFALVILLASCSNGSKDEKGKLTDMKVQLEKLKSEKSKLETEIKKIEDELLKSDPEANAKRAKLIAVKPVTSRDFTHYIDLQGKVDADNIVIVMPRGMPAQVKQLYIKRGDMVKKGQLLVKLDDAVIMQQMESLKTQLAFAKNIYQRQKNLWDQNIGTEVQLISAKNGVDGIEKQIATLEENWKTSFVYAPISGIADEVNVKVGETFTGVFGTSPQIRIVNTSSLKIVTEVPENYLGRIGKGTKVEILVPDAGKSYQSVVSMTGASISLNTRAFITEARIPTDANLKINQVAVVRMQDYASNDVVVIPVNLVQIDEAGRYVYVMANENEKMVARKKMVITGESYDGMVEIKSGLTAGEQMITEGYQSVYDGQVVMTVKG
jgi:membrane fusion protein, multidrug efflux system